MSTIVGIIQHYQRSIEKCPGDESRLLHCIEKLCKLPVTVDHLQETGIGKTVNALRKYDGDVGVAAKALVTKWKNMVAAEEDVAISNPHSVEKNRHLHQSQSSSNHSGTSLSKSRSGEKLNGYKDTSTSTSTKRRESEEIINYHSSRKKEKYEKLDKRKYEIQNIDDRPKPEKLPESQDKKKANDYDYGGIGLNDSFEKLNGHDNTHDFAFEAMDFENAYNQYEDDEDEDEEKLIIIDDQRDKTDECDKKNQKSEKSDMRKSSSDSHHKHKSDIRERESKSSRKDEKSSKSSSEKDRKKDDRDSRHHKDKHHEKSERSGDKSDRSEKREKDKIKERSDKNEKNERRDRDRSAEKSDRRNRDTSAERSEKRNRDRSAEKSERRDRDRSSEKSSKDKIEKSDREDKKEKRDRHEKKEEKDKKQERSEKERTDKSSSKHKEEKSERTSSKDEGSSHRNSSKDSREKESKKHKRDPKELANGCDEPVPKKMKKATVEVMEEGIDCSMGKSFEEALGMIVPSTSSKSTSKNKPPKSNGQLNKSGSSNSNDKPGSSSSSSSSSLFAVPAPPRSKTPPLLTAKAKLEPLDPAIALELPTISNNYKPLPLNPTVMECVFSPNKPQRRQMTDEEALAAGISSKTIRTKVYSGARTGVLLQAPSLFDLCIRVLQKNIDALEYTGGVPFEVLKPVLERATPQQLLTFEDYNPYLMEDSDTLWQHHINRHYRGKKRLENESWREMFIRCKEEQDERLSMLTENIKLSQKKEQLPIKKTQLAYVDSAVKPPRSILRKQEIYGTKSKVVATPAARVAALSNVTANIAKVGDSRLKSAPGARDTAQASSSARPRKAPLMQKTLQFMKGRFRRK